MTKVLRSFKDSRFVCAELVSSYAERLGNKILLRQFYVVWQSSYEQTIRLVPRQPAAPLRYPVRVVPDTDIARGSFEELAMPLFSQLYNFACWLAGDRAIAEDLVQETYLKACRGFSSYRQGTNFRAWMYRILRNTFLTSRTGLQAISSLDSDDDPAMEPETAETPESILLAARDRETIIRALEALPVHYREIVLLCDLEEMSYQEIGQTLAIPIGTVMSRLSRGRKAMRALLAPAVKGASR